MGSCSTKQEVVSQTSTTATPVAIVLRPSGFAKGSKVHASDSPFRTRVDSFRSRSDSFRSRADSKSLIDAVSREIVKAGDKMKDNHHDKSLDTPIILVDKAQPEKDKNEDEHEKSVKRNGTHSDDVKSKLNKKREKKKQKAMRIGDFALIVEIKDQGTEEKKDKEEKTEHKNKVANPPEKSKDDTNLSSRNGQLSRTGSLTVLRRSNSRTKVLSNSSSRTSSVASLESDSYASVDLGTDKLPPVDVPEASHVCSLRLRHILRKLQKEEVSKDDLQKNLEYAAQVLETVYIDETSPKDFAENEVIEIPFNELSGKAKKTLRRLCDEEDELSEVEPDAVPTEVRDWLALTFTRSMSNVKRRGEEKPKFRSVANAIRAGIMVDRIYRRLSSTTGLNVPPHVLLILKHLDDWTFNVFSVNSASDGHALKYVGYELLQKYDLITKFKISNNHLDNFLLQLEVGYSKYKNPYHNLAHGADVTQTVHTILSQSKLVNWLTDLEVFATILAALIHDYEHTGTTNNFHIQTSSEVALLYNDRAVLENHHISAAFRLMQSEEHNILANLSKEEYRQLRRYVIEMVLATDMSVHFALCKDMKVCLKTMDGEEEFRNLVIDMVLATDMSYHFQQIKNMKNLLSMPENIDKPKALSLVLHCADISHPAKDWDIHKRWTDLLLEEFFRQGDREQELGLPFSPLCDRKNTLVAESQIGFIDFIVEPSFQVMGDMLDKILCPLRSSSSHAVDEAISEEVFDKETTTRGTSAGKSLAKPVTPTSSKSELCVRPWVDCLSNNKVQWKAIAVKDAEERKKNEEAEGQSNEASDKKPEPEKKPADNKSAPKVGVSRQTSTTGLPRIDSRGNIIVNRQTSTTSLPIQTLQSRTTSTTGLINRGFGARSRIVEKVSTGSDAGQNLLLDSESDSDMDIGALASNEI